MRHWRALGVLAFASLIYGCQSPMSHMMNNNFVATNPEPVPGDLAGLRGLYLGFTAARVVITSTNLGIFDLLRKPSPAVQPPIS